MNLTPRLTFAGASGVLFLSMLLIPSFESRGQSFDENIDHARAALEEYDFTEAARYLAAARKKIRTDEPTDRPVVEMYERQMALAKNFIGRVEKIEILDSINVSKDDFFKAYRLPSSAGSIEGPQALPFRNDEVEMVFTNEGGDFKMWAQPDSTGYYNIAESIRLTDGSWSKPSFAPEELGDGANAEFPFMMADGVTLYFASDGEGSLGGYDIFVATRDPQTGEYLQPQNIGMPYNSPFDDYLLAIDELNGVGWWATDRNRLGDDLTIYLYKVNDTRVNYDPDEEEDIRELALISDFRATQDPDKDYSGILEAVKNISSEKKKRADFHFPRKGGEEYTTLDDFRTSEGKVAMERFLKAKAEFDSNLDNLVSLRRQYAASPDQELKQRIRELENVTESQREQLKIFRNDIYRAEGN